MRDPFTIIRTARITEKGSTLNEKGQYVFEVDLKATKQEIAHAVETIFKKDVVRVNTLRLRGKWKRSRNGRYGRTNTVKKAIVTLKEGETLSFA